jgi:hypothetical protein
MLNILQNPSGIKCHSYGNDINGVAYLPQLRQDLAYQPKEAAISVKKSMILGAIDGAKKVYIIDIKKKELYSVSDVEKTAPITPRPKIKTKVWIDLDAHQIYDYEYTKLGSDQPPIASYNPETGVIKGG